MGLRCLTTFPRSRGKSLSIRRNRPISARRRCRPDRAGGCSSFGAASESRSRGPHSRGARRGSAEIWFGRGASVGVAIASAGHDRQAAAENDGHAAPAGGIDLSTAAAGAGRRIGQDQRPASGSAANRPQAPVRLTPSTPKRIPPLQQAAQAASAAAAAATSPGMGEPVSPDTAIAHAAALSGADPFAESPFQPEVQALVTAADEPEMATAAAPHYSEIASPMVGRMPENPRLCSVPPCRRSRRSVGSKSILEV